MYIPANTKVPYKTYPILLKTHRTTFFLEAPAGKTVSELKADALDALTSRAQESTPAILQEQDETEDEPIPSVSSTDDFELCRIVKEKGPGKHATSTFAQPAEYALLSGNDVVQKVAQPWEALYLRFVNADGILMPVNVTLPSMVAEADEEVPEASSSKGKGKA